MSVFPIVLFRMFSFGIGTGASTALVRGVARAGKGIADFVIGKERLQAKVEDLYCYLLIVDLIVVVVLKDFVSQEKVN